MRGSGCWILDAGYWTLDAGCCWMLDAGYWMLGVGYWMLWEGMQDTRRNENGETTLCPHFHSSFSAFLHKSEADIVLPGSLLRVSTPPWFQD